MEWLSVVISFGILALTINLGRIATALEKIAEKSAELPGVADSLERIAEKPMSDLRIADALEKIANKTEEGKRKNDSRRNHSAIENSVSKVL